MSRPTTNHRRIQDFVGGGKAPSPGSAPDYCAAVNYLATQIHICEGFFGGEGGAKAPLAPPPGSAPANSRCGRGPRPDTGEQRKYFCKSFYEERCRFPDTYEAMV